MRLDRLNEMEHFIYRKGNVSLQELSQHFDVSLNTVRRDLKILLKNGTVKKVYGGVAAIKAAMQDQVSERELECLDEKRLIAQMAAELIPDNATLYLDTGSTVSEIVPFLLKKKNITIVTNSMRVIERMVPHADINLFVPGGFYSSEISGFVGITVIDNLNRLAFDTAIIGASGVSLDGRLMTGFFSEEPIKRHVLTHSKRKAILLADSTKFDRTALFSFGEIQDIDCIVTNQEPSLPFKEKFAQLRIEVIYPDGPGAGGKREN